MKHNGISRWMIATIVLGLGIWFLIPGRNIAGNPQSEILIDECVAVESGERIRLYRGDGGATVAYWYSLTMDPGMFARERQFFYAYSSPQIDNLRCENGEVTLVGLSQSFSFPVEKIYREMFDRPMILYRGQPDDVSNGLRVVTVCLGLVLSIIGLSIAFWRPKRIATPSAQ